MVFFYIKNADGFTFYESILFFLQDYAKLRKIQGANVEIYSIGIFYFAHLGEARKGASK